MARLIVLDASVAVAALARDEAHHQAASAALFAAVEDEFVLAATTRAEILVGPTRIGGTTLRAAQNFVDGCPTIPISALVADRAADLRAAHRALSLPDTLALAVAELVDADEVWTFDRRWKSLDQRVVIPGSQTNA